MRFCGGIALLSRTICSIMPDDQDWVICGVTITPFPFHHGHYFDRSSRPARPLICSAFLIDSTVLYISDVRCVLIRVFAPVQR